MIPQGVQGQLQQGEQQGQVQQQGHPQGRPQQQVQQQGHIQGHAQQQVKWSNTAAAGTAAETHPGSVAEPAAGSGRAGTGPVAAAEGQEEGADKQLYQVSTILQVPGNMFQRATVM